jgi:nucleotide-binding universal stress UspA family protein
MKVLVALDGSENSYDALRRALELTKPDDSLVLVHTIEEIHPARVRLHSPFCSPLNTLFGVVARCGVSLVS